MCSLYKAKTEFSEHKMVRIRRRNAHNSKDLTQIEFSSRIQVDLQKVCLQQGEENQGIVLVWILQKCMNSDMALEPKINDGWAYQAWCVDENMAIRSELHLRLIYGPSSVEFGSMYCF